MIFRRRTTLALLSAAAIADRRLLLAEADSSAVPTSVCLSPQPAGSKSGDESTSASDPPFVAGKTLVDGKVIEAYAATDGTKKGEGGGMQVETMADVLGCCSLGGSNDGTDTDDNAETCQALQPSSLVSRHSSRPNSRWRC